MSPNISTSLADRNLDDRRVLLRADLNVPLDDSGRVTDTFRLQAILPTLRLLIQKQAKIIILSHLGRPEGNDPTLSLKPVADALEKLLGYRVGFCPHTIGAEAEAAVAALQPGEILLLENLRFDPREEKNDPVFAEALSQHGDLFVNDGFAVSHRAHASTVGVTRFMPSVAGPLMQHELTMLGRALDAPEAPLLALVGGAKISTKLALLKNLSGKADTIFIGGAMANTFLAAQGIDIGPSLAEPDLIPTANTILLEAGSRRCDIMLPFDAVLGQNPKTADTKIAPVMALPPGYGIYDIGPATLLRLKETIWEARTIIWNGPLGLFENPAFSQGTFEVAKLLAEAAQKGATVVAGGGDTVAALTDCGLMDAFTFVSTAGGAFLEWMEGKELPGVKALKPS